MSEAAEPCHHDGRFEPHGYARGCPGHPHNGLIPIIADWLDRLDAGDPEAVEGLNRLLGPDLDSDSPEILPREVRDQITHEIEEMARVRAQGAAAGANYLIGETSAIRESPCGGEVSRKSDLSGWL